MTRDIGDSADNRNGIATAVVGGSWCIEAPGGALLYSLVGVAAGDDRCGGVDNGYFLTASAAVTASVGCCPSTSGIKSRAAMTGNIGYSADNGNGIATT